MNTRGALVLAAGWLVANFAAAVDVDAVVSKAAGEYMAGPHTVGLSIGVIQAGTSHSYHFGSVSKEQIQPPDDRTIYPIASLTKTFTGTLLAQAQLDNKLKVDDDVRRCVDAPNLVFEQQPVRLYHLLNHRSGLPFMLPQDDFYTALRQVKLTSAPGSHFQYSNAAAQLAGYILEGAYGSSFETQVKQRIANPLGMTDTVITLSPQQEAREVAGYDASGTRQPYGSDQVRAAGALKSTLADMLKYAQWQLAESDPAVRLSHQATYTDDDFSIGLNWQMLTREQRRVIWQDGAIPGFGSMVVLEPDSGIAVVMLSNELDATTLGRFRKLVNDITSKLDVRSLAVP